MSMSSTRGVLGRILRTVLRTRTSCVSYGRPGRHASCHSAYLGLGAYRVSNSGGYVSGVLCRSGCVSGIVMTRTAKFRLRRSRRTRGGRMDASTSIAAEGELRKAPRIFRVAKFWRRWSLSTKCFCPFHQITAPKSLIVVIHVMYSCRKSGAKIPHSDVASLLIVCKTCPAAATLRLTWLVNVNVLSNHTPSQRATVPGLITVPLGSLTEVPGSLLMALLV